METTVNTVNHQVFLKNVYPFVLDFSDFWWENPLDNKSIAINIILKLNDFIATASPAFNCDELDKFVRLFEEIKHGDDTDFSTLLYIILRLENCCTDLGVAINYI